MGSATKGCCANNECQSHVYGPGYRAYEGTSAMAGIGTQEGGEDGTEEACGCVCYEMAEAWECETDDSEKEFDMMKC